MAKIREKKYSYERYPETSIWRHPSDHQKEVIQTAEDGELAKFFEWDGGENTFTFNDKDLKTNRKAITDWLKKFPEFEVLKGTFEAFYGPKENYDEYTIKYPNDKYIYLVTDYNPFENLETKPYTYEPKDDEVILVDMWLNENKLKEWYNVKTPLDYIEDKLQDANIDYTVEQAWGDKPYDTWITINDGQDSLADEIICSVVGYAYDWVRDKFGNRKYCKVATDEDTINELNESLKGNHSFKGLTKKVVEAKETCSQDYLRYKKQLQKAKSIDELRKVWQIYRKDYDADMTPEEDKHLANLFLDRKKELKENLKEGKTIIPEKANLKKILDRFNSNGKFAKQGNWKIARGGYNLAFQLYYDNLALLDGINDGFSRETRLELDRDTYGANDEYNVKDLANYVCQVYNDCKIDENLKESWIQFTFEDGSNPYVAKTKEEQDRMFKKYKGRVEQVSDITYLVKSEKKKTNESLKESKTNTFEWEMDQIKYARSIYDLYKLDDIISNSNDLTPEEISKLRHEISCRKSEMWTNQGRGR